MPRQARLDVPGALHHVMMRGINKERLFVGGRDYEEFAARLGKHLKWAKAKCYAWALMPNHVHLLLQTGSVSLSLMMQRLLTGYAGWFNRRHHRSGRLYQNRYKSVLCDRDAYLMELARYIHLNPLRAGVVRDMKGLAEYPWCGHGVLTGKRKSEWQDTGMILGRYGNSPVRARRRYEEFVSEGVKAGRREDLVGGGLLRSAGGYVEYLRRRHGEEEILGDERILGDSEFVSKAMKSVEERESTKSKARRRWTVDGVIGKAAEEAGIEVEEVKANGKRPAQCKGRALACYWLVEVLGKAEVEAGVMLGITQPAVSRNVGKGRVIAAKENIKLG